MCALCMLGDREVLWPARSGVQPVVDVLTPNPPAVLPATLLATAGYGDEFWTGEWDGAWGDWPRRERAASAWLG